MRNPGSMNSHHRFDVSTDFFAAHLLHGNSLATMLMASLINPAPNSEFLDSCRDPILRSHCLSVSDNFQQHFLRVGDYLWYDTGGCA